tara:strand:+ start:10091 stop:10348 length:258 start_codon:yes stop_codon:yes gene_type:complete
MIQHFPPGTILRENTTDNLYMAVNSYEPYISNEKAQDSGQLVVGLEKSSREMFCIRPNKYTVVGMIAGVSIEPPKPQKTHYEIGN